MRTSWKLQIEVAVVTFHLKRFDFAGERAEKNRDPSKLRDCFRSGMVHRFVGLVTDVCSATEDGHYTACAALRVPDVAALVFSAIGQSVSICAMSMPSRPCIGSM